MRILDNGRIVSRHFVVYLSQKGLLYVFQPWATSQTMTKETKNSTTQKKRIYRKVRRNQAVVWNLDGLL